MYRPRGVSVIEDELRDSQIIREVVFGNIWCAEFCHSCAVYPWTFRNGDVIYTGQDWDSSHHSRPTYMTRAAERSWKCLMRSGKGL